MSAERTLQISASNGFIYVLFLCTDKIPSTRNVSDFWSEQKKNENQLFCKNHRPTRIQLQWASNIFHDNKMERVFMTFRINLSFWWNLKFYASNIFRWKCINNIAKCVYVRPYRDKDAQCVCSDQHKNDTMELNSRAV